MIKLMTKNSQNQTGSALVAIIIIAVVALVGILGYVAWNKISVVDKNETPQQTTTVSTPNEDKKPQDSNEGYLVLHDWGVKFKLPNNVSEVRYYKESIEDEHGVFEYYQLTTTRVESLGGECAPDAANPIRLSSISRSLVKKEELASAFPANENKPIGGYYYYVSGGQSLCSDDHTDWQSEDNTMTSNLLSHPVSLN